MGRLCPGVGAVVTQEKAPASVETGANRLEPPPGFEPGTCGLQTGIFAGIGAGSADLPRFHPLKPASTCTVSCTVTCTVVHSRGDGSGPPNRLVVPRVVDVHDGRRESNLPPTENQGVTDQDTSGTPSDQDPTYRGQSQEVSSSSVAEKQTSPTHKHPSSGHKRCRICVGRFPDLVELKELWPVLPEPVRPSLDGIAKASARQGEEDER